MKKKYIIQTFVLLFLFIISLNFSRPYLQDIPVTGKSGVDLPAFYKADTVWVDSVLQSMSIDEKIGQFFMIPAYSDKADWHRKEVADLIHKYKVGGIIFFTGGPVRQALLTNYFQSVSETPLLIAMDAENGLAMRLDSTISYPQQMMLGAIPDNSLIYQAGYDIAGQLKRIGVNLNFAPLVDINNNPLNPVINYRSFGEDRVNVATKGLMFAKGMEDAGVLCTYKHFPGHGDSNTDSHYSLPIIKQSRERLDSVELYPFKYGIDHGISGIMTGHLNVPALDSTKNRASSISPLIVNNLLKDSLHFQGLIITDALGMNGVSAFARPGEAALLAFQAGNDILLMSKDIVKAISLIKREYKKGHISEDEINSRCRKILLAKAWAGLNKYKAIKIDSIYEDINKAFYEVEKRKLISNSVTLLKNSGRVVPFYNLENYKIASLAIGTGQSDAFSRELGLYSAVDTFFVKKDMVFPISDSLNRKFSNYNTLIISIQNTTQWPGSKYGITESTIKFLNELDFKGNVVLTIFGNAYSLSQFDNFDKFNAIVLSYEDNALVKELTAQAIFGAIEIQGRIPVTASEEFPYGYGLKLSSIDRLRYGIPEDAKLNSGILSRIDTIVNDAIHNKAMPGCQVLVARYGEVVFHKAYGYQTYRSKKKCSTGDIYDIASLTKIAATLPSLMRLEDHSAFDTDRTLGDYLVFNDTCNKKSLIVKDILAHQSGLKAWIPFYYKTIEPLDTGESLVSTNFSYTYPLKIGPSVYANRNIEYVDRVYESSYSDSFAIKVANGLFLRTDYRDSIFKWIDQSELLSKEYRYSDLGYYYFKKIIENLTDTAIYLYNYYHFYAKLGTETLGYLPLNRFPADRIVPTENDIFFRHQLLRGYVHDPGAAMIGGIAGHAGLFSNANDLAKLMQMYLNKGVYGGRRYLSSGVIEKYTERVFTDNGNRRALGFDKPETDTTKASPASRLVSANSFGHTGFTGTMAWADPDYDLVYIFLSNRIHPDQYNLKLIEMDVRTRIQDVIYESVIP
jgi:beta-N-acetylhexosaminidase